MVQHYGVTNVTNVTFFSGTVHSFNTDLEVFFKKNLLKPTITLTVREKVIKMLYLFRITVYSD